MGIVCLRGWHLSRRNDVKAMTGARTVMLESGAATRGCESGILSYEVAGRESRVKTTGVTHLAKERT